MNRSFQSRARSALVPLLAGLATALCAAGPSPGPSISGQWIRALSKGLPAAGYFTLDNALDRPVRLVGASSPACGSLTLHQTMVRHTMSAMSALDPDNPRQGRTMSSMQAVAAVPVPAHGMVRFTPGGYHLMCEQPTDAVQPGHRIPVRLVLADGASIEADFPVTGPRGQPGAEPRSPSPRP